jgi:DivIVA domain-containing protein
VSTDGRGDHSVCLTSAFMELSPQSVRTTAFKTVKKGYDPGEVDAFKGKVASAIETAQNQATAMEARARAAVAKLQELSQQVGTATAPKESTPAAAPSISVSADDAEYISRTLLLAQRTADTTVADARREAESITTTARNEAAATIEEARVAAAKLVEDSRIDGRRASEDERMRAEGEVQSLMARRDFLVSDVDHLEQHVGAQRERLRDAASALHELVDRVPGGLGEMRRPLLSASADPAPAPSAALNAPEPAHDVASEGYSDGGGGDAVPHDTARQVFDTEPTPVDALQPQHVSDDEVGVGRMPEGGFAIGGEELR